MSALSSPTDDFRGWRRYLWPVHTHEIPKLLPLALLFFLVALNYNMLRTVKDTLLITAKGSGAEVIPFVKVWAMLPGAILMTLLYTFLARRLSRERLFYVMVSLFLGYFLLFTFVLYPYRNTLHPHMWADQMESIFPLGFKGLITMFRYWTFTLFYVMSELWGTMILFVLLWGYINQITKVSEAKRLYGLYVTAANIGGMLAGEISVICCHQSAERLFIGQTPWEQSLIFIISIVLLSGVATLFLFRWLNQRMIRANQQIGDESVAYEKTIYKKMSFIESFRYLLTSKHLISIAVIVLGYNIVNNLTEVVWKHQVHALYPDPNAFTLYMNQVVALVGFAATLSSIFVSGNLLRRLGWTVTALLTPIIMLITSIGFFGCFFYKEYFPLFWGSLLPIHALGIVVFWGSLQNIFGRAAKYTVFDSTKEMAFIPLGNDAKIIGKASIDGVCSRLGKSGGSIIYQGLLLFCSTITASVPYVAFALLFVIAGWMGATRSLGKSFTLLTENKEKEEARELLEGEFKEQKAT